MIFGSPPIVTSGLVLNLDAGNTKSYPRSGTVWRDLSGNNNSGSLVNGPTYNSQNGGSIVFDGVDDYVNYGSSFQNVTTQLSIFFWGRINGSPADGILVTKGEADNTITSNFGFQIVSGNALRLYAKASGQSYTTRDSNSNILDNNINCYTCIYSSGLVSFYKNGYLFSSNSFGLSSLPSSVGPLYVAALKGYPNYYSGNVYNILVYNRALTPTEVQQNYNALKSRFNLQ